MNSERGAIEKMHEEQGRQKINEIMKKIDTTQYNIEVSTDIIADTPSDTIREKLIEQNTRRQHAIGSMKKEILDIEKTMEKRGKEVST